MNKRLVLMSIGSQNNVAELCSLISGYKTLHVQQYFTSLNYMATEIAITERF